jgi:hypothetical protein
MGGNKYFLILAMVGMVIWNIPYTASTFTGDHTYYGDSVQCTKCHDVDIGIHTGTTAHDNFTCASCHRSEPGVIYQSKGVAGNTAHAASMSSCSNCHNATVLTSGPTTALTSGPTTVLAIGP